jgi:hypothetical protein
MRKRAAFTIVQNEPVFLPIWLDYYSRSFEPADLYVLDHASTDGSTDALAARCHVVPIHRDASFDHAWLNGTVTAFHAFLLRSYQQVLFTEADEIVLADPLRYRGLDAYIDACIGRVARCTGFEVVHFPEEEPPLDFNRPLLAQRQYWLPSRMYSKTLLASVPMAWSPGFHEAPAFAGVRPDPDLYLVHLHRIDYAACAARHRSTAARRWSTRDLDLKLGQQNRMVDGDAGFRSWFFQGLDNGARALIPAHVKAAL